MMTCPVELYKSWAVDYGLSLEEPGEKAQEWNYNAHSNISAACICLAGRRGICDLFRRNKAGNRETFLRGSLYSA